MGFKVLFVYPNLSMTSMVPQSIALLSAVLRDRGIDTAVFDTTFYELDLNDPNLSKVKSCLVRGYSFEERGISKKPTNVLEDFKSVISKFQPNLLAFSLVEDTFALGKELMAAVRDMQIPVVAGGAFCTYAADKVARCKDVDFIVRGEGEGALAELCESLMTGKGYRNILNLCYRDGEGMTMNPIRPPADLETLPPADYSIFPEETLYRPMVGKVWRTIGVETQRGCPFTCGYCGSAACNKMYWRNARKIYFRKKSMKAFAKELENLANTVRPELVYFLADCFLMMKDREFDEFCEIYSQYRLPFFMQSRAETVNEDKIKRLERLNCVRANVGLEHGNEEFRRTVIKRNLKNDRILKAVRILGSSSISTAVNNIIGFPLETRELIFDTIRLNREIAGFCDTIGCFVFAPYHGTALRQKAIELGYLDDETLADSNSFFSSVLDMPQLSREAIQGLHRTFVMYVRFPESRWPEIRKAEEFTPEGDEAHTRLAEELRANYPTG